MPSKNNLHPTKCYAFDVDNTLNLGPLPGSIDIRDVEHLKNSGTAIVGLSGNYHVALKYWPNWFVSCSFFGPYDGNKPTQLKAIKHAIQLGNPMINDYIMVGNRAQDAGTMLYGHLVPASSNDDGKARLAGWRFISEADFAQGKR